MTNRLHDGHDPDAPRSAPGDGRRAPAPLGLVGRGAGGFRGRDAKVPQIRSGNADVRGSLSKEVIRRVIQRHINEVRFCYEQELNKEPNLKALLLEVSFPDREQRRVAPQRPGREPQRAHRHVELLLDRRVLAEVEAESGKHFDPAIVRSLFRCLHNGEASHTDHGSEPDIVPNDERSPASSGVAAR